MNGKQRLTTGVVGERTFRKVRLSHQCEKSDIKHSHDPVVSTLIGSWKVWQQLFIRRSFATAKSTARPSCLRWCTLW